MTNTDRNDAPEWLLKRLSEGLDSDPVPPESAFELLDHDPVPSGFFVLDVDNEP